MGRARGVGRRKQKKLRYNVSKKRLWKKAKKLPKITCSAVKDAWDESKGLQANFTEMGLSANPNKTMKVESWRVTLNPKTIDEEDSEMVEAEEPTVVPKIHVVDDLELMAQEKKGSGFKLPNDIVNFCVYMLDKYGDDYKAMARDRKNHYQETPKKIRKLINDFKKSKNQYEMYLKLKNQQKDET